MRLILALTFLCLPLTGLAQNRQVVVSPQQLAQGEEKRIELSLTECISLALKSNLNIRIQRIDPQIQDGLVTRAQGRFDPALTFGPTLDASEEPSLTPFIAGADIRTSDTQGFSVQLEILSGLKAGDTFIMGGKYSLRDGMAVTIAAGGNGPFGAGTSP